jgi:hypothetical protein
VGEKGAATRLPVWEADDLATALLYVPLMKPATVKGGATRVAPPSVRLIRMLVSSLFLRIHRPGIGGRRGIHVARCVYGPYPERVLTVLQTVVLRW